MTRREGHKRLAKRVCCARRPSCRSSDSGGLARDAASRELTTKGMCSEQQQAIRLLLANTRSKHPLTVPEPVAAPGFCRLTVQCLLIESEMQTAKATRQPLNRKQLKCSIQMQLAS